ncbi:hypothetical protein EYR40_006031 [Pleurotus pulmonarius]|nr:hypothetical protein EYR40_006031 [Pleurotus pulmonarius]
MVLVAGAGRELNCSYICALKNATPPFLSLASFRPRTLGSALVTMSAPSLDTVSSRQTQAANRILISVDVGSIVKISTDNGGRSNAVSGSHPGVNVEGVDGKDDKLTSKTNLSTSDDDPGVSNEVKSIKASLESR